MVKYGVNTVCSIVQGLTNNLAISASLYILSLSFIIEFDSIGIPCHPIVVHAFQHLYRDWKQCQKRFSKNPCSEHFFKMIFTKEIFWKCKKKSETKVVFHKLSC